GDPAIGWSWFDGAARDAFVDAYGGIDADAARRARLIALDYGGALIPYGQAIGDPAAVALGHRAVACATR
ncbi:MAG: hypothetical protein ABMB14_38135, partial [Myxococcota bacterium]